MSTQYVILKYVYIEPTQVNPATLTVKQDDQVMFQMSGRTDIVTVDFGLNSPFGPPNSFDLNGGNQLLASQSKSVIVTSTQSYPFTVTPKSSRHLPGGDPEPPGTLSGDIDVSTDDPPKDK